MPWESCTNTLVITIAQPLRVIRLFVPTSIDSTFWYKCTCTYKYVLRIVVQIYLYLQISGQQSCTNTLVPTNCANYKCIYLKLQKHLYLYNVWSTSRTQYCTLKSKHSYLYSKSTRRSRAALNCIQRTRIIIYLDKKDGMERGESRRRKRQGWWRWRRRRAFKHIYRSAETAI